MSGIKSRLHNRLSDKFITPNESSNRVTQTLIRSQPRTNCQCLEQKTYEDCSINITRMYYTGTDIGILEWWGDMTNAHNKNVGHAHFIKTTPILFPSRAAP